MMCIEKAFLGMPINSIDCHPLESKIVTGGEDNSVRIWSLSAILDENVNDEGVESVTMLCKIINHTGPVYTVRFSSDGKYLASGGDDKSIMIWERKEFGSNLGGDIENWSLVSGLAGHHGDVRDLAWMPNDDTCLASCSIDSCIIIWQCKDNVWSEKIKLTNHKNAVKGLSFDPIRKYLVSQSNDNTLRVWNTSEWHQVACVSDLSATTGTTATFGRPSWAPDGQFVSVPQCSSGGYPTATVLRRDHWEVDKAETPSFVGHISPVVCSRWSPRLYGSDKQYKTYCVLGSRDNALSIWTAAENRAIVAARDLFADTVLDLCWSPCGLILLGCSHDGTIGVLQFTTDEIGAPMSTLAQETLLKGKYGIGTGLGVAIQAHIPESVDQLPSHASITPPKTSLNVPPAATAIAPVSGDEIKRLQIETKTKEGRRRLAPTPLLVNTTSAPVIVSTPVLARTSTSENLQPNQTSLKSTLPNVLSKQSLAVDRPTRIVSADLSRVKRVSSGVGQGETGALKKKKKASLSLSHSTSSTSASHELAVKGKLHDRMNFTDGLDGYSRCLKPVGVSFDMSMDDGAHEEDKTVDEHVCVESKELMCEMALGDTKCTIHVKNRVVINMNDDKVAKITCLNVSGAIIWDSILPSMSLDAPLHVMSCTKTFLMAITTQGRCFVWDIDTKRAVVYDLSVWRVIRDASPAIDDNGHESPFRGVSITRAGRPLLLTVSKKAWVHDGDLRQWICVSDCDSIISRSSLFHNKRFTFATTSVSDVLSSMSEDDMSLCGVQALTTSLQGTRGVQMLDLRTQIVATRCDLENQIVLANRFGTMRERRATYLDYVRYQTEHNDADRLRALLLSISCKNYRYIISSQDSHEADHKAWVVDLLADILPILATHNNPEFQQLASEFRKVLEDIQLDALSSE
eukprot:CFRG5038T1